MFLAEVKDWIRHKMLYQLVCTIYNSDDFLNIG
jgi:hypothetical protein